MVLLRYSSFHVGLYACKGCLFSFLVIRESQRTYLTFALQVFKKWIDAKNRQHASKIVVSKTRCPICNEERLDLKKHLIGQHNFDYGRAVGLKSQLNVYKGKSRLPSVLRKSKPRFYEKKLCPVDGCHKVSSSVRYREMPAT